MLPFVNMSGDPEQEYFSDGITEDIITDLSKVSALVRRRPKHRLHVQGADGRREGGRADARRRPCARRQRPKAGNRVRITAQLIDGEAGDHHWADRYDRDLTDIFAIQDEISKAIVGALRLKAAARRRAGDRGPRHRQCAGL